MACSHRGVLLCWFCTCMRPQEAALNPAPLEALASGDRQMVGRSFISRSAGSLYCERARSRGGRGGHFPVAGYRELPRRPRKSHTLCSPAASHPALLPVGEHLGRALGRILTVSQHSQGAVKMAGRCLPNRLTSQEAAFLKSTPEKTMPPSLCPS